MSTDLNSFLSLATLMTVFISVALLTGVAVNMAIASPARKRLHRLPRNFGTDPAAGAAFADDQTNGFWGPMLELPAKVRPDFSELRATLTRAGFTHASAPLVYSLLQVLVPASGAAAVLTWVTGPNRLLYAAVAAVLAFFIPGLVVDYRLLRRRRLITNGLPDALDLLVVCLEAGCGLDQALVKTGDELVLAYPALADEIRLTTTEMRAGKPRLDALRALAVRTRVDDVRQLVALLIQTDKFGTSIGQALRIHADVSREKRRQRAEQQAAKLAAKLVFPLVLCLFPALYVVILGPAVIQFVRTMMQ